MNPDNTFRILLSTDNHLGFSEKDPVRGNDSFITFEEILKVSQEKKPDFILLGGDLFHENKPSISSLFKCTELIRKYSFNSNPIKFKIVSDQSLNFSHSKEFRYSNFNDENLNVGLPIFSIHGNHDDPIDQDNLCALDIFHASGLINLFGKTPSVESIVVQPILMCKGKTKIALYGLGAIRNERLHRLFQQEKVKFLRPSEQTDDWFSIFVIHQNRVKHGATNYIPETFLPNFINLVIWGHEHDCRISPEYNTSQEFYVSQPGSSVATSLSEGEATEKFIGLLEINKNDFTITKYKLKTIRPLVIDNIILEDEDELSINDPKINKKVESLCHKRMEQLISMSEALITNHPNQPTLPLIRLRVDYSGGFEMFSIIRFNQEYADKVANPKDMLVLHRKREQSNKEALSNQNVVLNVRNVKDDCGLDAARVEDLVKQHFAKLNEKLHLLNEKELGYGVKLSVDKDNKDILGRVVNKQIDIIQNHLKQKQTNENYIYDEINRFMEISQIMHDDEDQNDETYLKDKYLIGSTSDVNVQELVVENMDEPFSNERKTSKRGRRGTGKTRGRSNIESSSSYFGVNTSNVSSVDNNSMDIDVNTVADSSRKRKMKSNESIQKMVKN